MSLWEIARQYGLPPALATLVFVITAVIVAAITRWLEIPASNNLIAGLALIVAIPVVAIWLYRRRTDLKKGI